MNKRGTVKLGIITIVCYLVLTLGISSFSDVAQYESNIIDDQIKTTVIKGNGDVATYESGETYQTARGDKVIAQIQIPRERYIKDSSIIIHIYNSVLRLYYKDQLLYEYGEDLARDGRMIGGVFVRACIPEEAWGEELRLECEVMEEGSITEIKDVMVIQTINSLKYFIVHHETEFVVFVTVIFASAAIFGILFFYGEWNSNVRKAMYLALCCGSLSVWLTTYNGMYFLFSDNIWLFTNLEYIGIIISPLPIMLYLLEENKKERYSLFYLVMTVGYAVMFLISTILNYTTRDYHYTKFIPYVHAIWGLIILLSVKSFVYRTYRRDKSIHALQCGIIITMFGFGLEMLRYNIEKYTAIRVGNIKSISSISILILLVTMAFTYTIQLGERILGEKEKQHLERIAFLDGLTGLANRRGCYEYFNKLKKSCYTIIYMDLNNLKPLNDNYGHDKGDHLICFLAKLLKERFEYEGFCGRLGGDEFVVVVEDKNIEYLSECMNQIVEKFDEANRNKEFPIEVSVAYGMAESTEENPIPILEAMKIADHNMYEIKKRYKANK